MAYRQISKELEDPRSSANAKMGKAAGAAATAATGIALKALKKPGNVTKSLKFAKRYMTRSKYRSIVNRGFKSDPEYRSKISKERIAPLVELLASLLGVTVSSIMAVKSRSKSSKRSVDRLTKMVQQGDIDPSDIFQYLKTADKQDSKVLLAVLDNIGYDGSDVSTFVGTYRKTRKQGR